LDETATHKRNNEGKDEDKLAYMCHTRSPHRRTPRWCCLDVYGAYGRTPSGETRRPYD
jgi:hypothetical protein